LGIDLDSPGALQYSPPHVDSPLDVVPLFDLEHEVVHTKYTCCFLDVSPCPSSFLVSSELHNKVFSLDFLTLADPTVFPPNHLPKSVDSLSLKPLHVSNLTTLIPFASLCYNITIRKNKQSQTS